MKKKKGMINIIFKILIINMYNQNIIRLIYLIKYYLLRIKMIL